MSDLEGYWSPEPVSAWRLYRVQRRAEEIIGPAPLMMEHGQTYQPGETYAAEHYHATVYEVPGTEPHDIVTCGSCGFHAYRTREDALDGLEDVRVWAWSRHLNIVLGAVLLWGTVVEHELGFRASRMTVLPFDMVYRIEQPFPPRPPITYDSPVLIATPWRAWLTL